MNTLYTIGSTAGILALLISLRLMKYTYKLVKGYNRTYDFLNNKFHFNPFNKKETSTGSQRTKKPRFF